MSIRIEGLPELQWTHGVGAAEPAGSGVTLTAAASSDWCNDAVRDGELAQKPSTSLVFAPGGGDFQFSAEVEVAHPRTTFDAAVLTVWADDRHWAKLCFEQSPQGEAMVVSVVTDGFSDDANGTLIDGTSVWLRISRIGAAFAFHYSLDSSRWHFARVFRLELPREPLVGIMAQAPHGELAAATFRHMTLTHRTLADLRNGE